MALCGIALKNFSKHSRMYRIGVFTMSATIYLMLMQVENSHFNGFVAGSSVTRFICCEYIILEGSASAVVFSLP